MGAELDVLVGQNLADGVGEGVTDSALPSTLSVTVLS